jgi:hypothetical protein
MSSVYRLLCMNHDPALALDHTWTSAEEAIAAALEPAMYDWLVEDHGKCDLLVGRYSASLVEVCCPASRERGGHGRHSGPQWVDRDWLALLHAASAAPADPALRGAIEDLARTHSCWTWERVNRLASELGIEATSFVPVEGPSSPLRSSRLRCAVTPAPGEAVSVHEYLRRAIRRALDYNERWHMDRPDFIRLNQGDADRYDVVHDSTLRVDDFDCPIYVAEEVPVGYMRVMTDSGYRDTPIVAPVPLKPEG